MKFSILGLILITILAIGLRLIGIYKTGGLWNDEYVSWMIASTPFNEGFWEAVKSQCHMPLYYLYLKFFMNVFNDSDIILRLTSVLVGVLSVIAMYFVGREKSVQTGLKAAIITALSSFLIYYSQEVRFYSLLFLFSALALLFTIRLLKRQNVFNLCGYVISNALILFTHTIGFVFVFFNLLAVSLRLYKEHKRVIIGLWSTITALFLLTLPLIIKIITTVSFSQWWKPYNIISDIISLFDFYTPTYNIQTPVLSILIIVILITALVLSWKELSKNELRPYLIMVIGVLGVMEIAAVAGKLAFYPKYAIEIFPIIIYITALIFSEIRNKYLKYVLFGIFVIINLIYIPSENFSAKQPRSDGHKYVADLLKNSQINSGDYIILNYYPQNRFEKYLNFENYNVIEIHKGNFNEYLTPQITYKEAVKVGKKVYLEELRSKHSSILSDKLNTEVFNKMKAGDKAVFVFLNNVAFLSEQDIENIVSNDKFYKKAPLLFMIFSHIKNECISEAMNKFKSVRYESKGDWLIMTITK